jgi:hypothetical protein
MDQMKKAFKGLFRGKKSKKEEPKPTATSEASTTPAQTKPSETTPAAPAPATAPEPAKTETAPAATSGASAPAPAEPAAVPASDPAQGEAKKDEAAALTEVKKATSSRLSSRSHSSPLPYHGDNAWHGSRRRQKVGLDNSQWNDAI